MHNSCEHKHKQPWASGKSHDLYVMANRLLKEEKGVIEAIVDAKGRAFVLSNIDKIILASRELKDKFNETSMKEKLLKHVIRYTQATVPVATGEESTIIKCCFCDCRLVSSKIEFCNQHLP